MIALRLIAALLLSASLASAATVRVNFQPELSSVPGGYLRDFGESYGSRNGQTYGWVVAGTTDPRDLVGEGRERGVAADPRLDTLVQMDRPGNPDPPGAWELALANGAYAVTLAVGDPADFSGEHWLTVEGVPAVLAFRGDATFPHATATVVVELSDGRLTLDASGGDDTRLHFVEVVDLVATRVNFQSADAPVPAGYARDFGESYGDRGGATYGWIAPGTQTPVDLTAEGRDREAIADQRLDTLIHMNRSGAPQNGSWEIEVVEPAYTVTVAAGDPSYTNSTHRILVEGSAAIDGFQPTGGETHRTATVAVAVGDGRLTIDGSSGTNAKINYVELVAAPGDNPRVSEATPTDGSNAVAPDVFVSASVLLPVASLDSATVNGDSVRLYPTGLPGQPVAAVVNTTGGGDAIVLDPVGALAPQTDYTFEITSGVRDLAGNAFLPYRSRFVTAAAAQTQLAPVTFDRATVDSGTRYTSLEVGPDGKLYALTYDGEIRRFAIGPDGTLSDLEILDGLQVLEGGPRLAIGLVHDPASTADSPVVWVTHTTFGFSGMPDWGGKITRLSGVNLETVETMVVGLPRSARDHVTNGAAFGPDGALYVLQGSNSAMGAPDTAWGNRPERALTGAVLRIDPGAIVSPPVDVRTEDGGSYDPHAPGAPVTVHASGVRNAYDLEWHSSGSLYVPTNGSAAGGNTPATPDPLTAACANRPDGPYTGPTVPAISGVNQTQHDFLYRIDPGGYYGHPAPTRCEWVLNGGNPTADVDRAQVTQYPVGTDADVNYRGSAYDFGTNKSPNGVVEYHGEAFEGVLRGALLVARYSGGDDLIVLHPDPVSGDIIVAFDDVDDFEGFADPLEVAEDPATGNLYVSEYGGPRLTLLRVAETGAAEVAWDPSALVFSAEQGTAATTQSTALLNAGNVPLSIASASLTGGDAATFTLSLPSLPLDLAPGESAAFAVGFEPVVAGPLSATLTVETDRGTTAVPLSGLGMQGLEGSNEPPLQQVVDALLYSIDVGGPSLSLGTAPSPIGDEIAEPLFVRATPGEVTMLPVARYSPSFALPFGGYLPDDGNPLHLEVGSLGDTLSPPAHQTLFPPIVLGGTAFDPGSGVFGLYTTSPTHGAYTEDSFNALLFPANVEHAARVYPLRDRFGVPIPFSYLVGFEEASNGDYQDYVFVLLNVRPAPFNEHPRLSALGSRFDWSRTAGGSLYDVVRGDLATLRANAGDYAATAATCLADDVTRYHQTEAAAPAPASAWWYLVRCADCLTLTYATAGAEELAGRDDIGACP